MEGVHSIELLLDGDSDRVIRNEWQALVDAGLPSQGRHSGATNAPHVTLVARPQLDDAHDAELADVMAALPLRADLAGLVVFGSPPRGLVLGRSVVQSSAIRRVHRAVHDLLGHDASPSAGLETPTAPDPGADHTLPDRWTPHVTLASRLTPQQLGEAVAVVAGRGQITVTFAAARRWDSDQRLVVPLDPRVRPSHPS